MSISDYLLYSLVGMSVVFFSLVLLMLMIKLMTFLISGENLEVNKEISITEKCIDDRVIEPSSVNIYDTDPRDAAMIMAIVADNIDIPVENLKFISIKEVNQ